MVGLKWAGTLFLIVAAVDDAAMRTDTADRAAIVAGYAAVLLGLWWTPLGVVVFASSAALALVADFYAIMVMTAPFLTLASASRGRSKAMLVTMAITVVTVIAANVGGRTTPDLAWIMLPLTLVAAAVGVGVWHLKQRHAKMHDALAAATEVHRLAEQANQQDLATRLHDDMGSALASAALMAARGEQHEDPDTARAFTDIRLACAAAATSLGRAVSLLREEHRAMPRLPLQLTDLAHELARTLRMCGWRVELDLAPDLDALPTSVRKLIGRFLIEASTNALKHSRPDTVVTMQVVRAGNRFEGNVESALGQRARVEAAGSGTGLASLKEAAEDLDAHVAWHVRDDRWILTLTGDVP